MNNLNNQLEIINSLSFLLFNAATDYDTAHLEYKFNPDEGWYSTRYWYTKNGVNFSPEKFKENLKQVKILCNSLHNVMQEHTGGDWRKFILIIDENQEVKTEFIYESQSYLDEFEF